MSDVTVKLVDMPCAVRGFTKKHPDGCTIFLNARLSHEQNVKTYLHEIDHIKKNHLDAELNTDRIECLMHGIT